MDSLSKCLKEDFLTCAICYELFTEPKTLSCLHNFCESCLETFVQKSSEKNHLSCPICREFTPLPSQTVSSLKTNFIFKEMVAKIPRSRGSISSRKCSFCILHSKEVEATHKCVTCMDLLCSFCTRHRHVFTRQNAYHKVVLLKDYLAGMYKEETKYEIPCEKHQERLRFLCQHCSVPICRECAVVEHRSHKYVTFVEAREFVKKEVEKNLQICKTKKEKLQTIQSSLISKSEEVSAKESSLLDMVDFTCKEIESKLNLHRQRIEQEIKRKSSEEKKNVDFHIQENLNFQDRIKESISFCENMLSKGSDLEVVFFLEEMKSCLLKCPDPKENQLQIALPTLKVNMMQEFNVFHLKDAVFDEDSPASSAEDTENSTELSNKVNESDEEYVEKTCNKPELSQENGDKNSEETRTEKSKDTTSDGACSKSARNTTQKINTESSNNSVNTKLEKACSEKTGNKVQKVKASGQSMNYQVPKCLKTYEHLDRHGDKNPSYTCITWIDRATFALVDELNQIVLIVSSKRDTQNIQKHLVKGIKAITKFGNFLACKTQSGEVKIYSFPDLKLERVFNGAFAVSSRSSELVWITKVKIVVFKNTSLQEMYFSDENGRQFKLEMPLYACCLCNKSFAISDKDSKCLYFFDKRAQKQHVITGRYGALSCDKENRVYLTNYETDCIFIFDSIGEWLKTISLNCIIQKPRSISVLGEEEILVSNKENVVLISLKR
ncbi:E3 ubiquitin-protein ligase TRIM56-like [Saccostrea echinata]|uniref:E3 ubiquitin-protein ligase TRIM56-like n=1 Tax=Saccostrea echinata TaxID=191078 RepID=UPI002A818130|nr:E3 ubiquitin-protein ligase TRIM56-like [Saccostrea echinata]